MNTLLNQDVTKSLPYLLEFFEEAEVSNWTHFSITFWDDFWLQQDV